MKQYKVGVVGATGAVGHEVVKLLESRKFPVGELRLFASARSVGKTMTFQGKEVPLLALSQEAFAGLDYVIFSAGASRSKEFAPAAVKAGAIVIDNSSAYRMAADVPLVVPEINPGDLKVHQGIIANPNCTAAILGTALWPLHRKAGIKRIIVSTYQSASGAGAQAMAELEAQVKQYVAREPITKSVFPHQIAFNVFSHNTAIGADGSNEEETKVREELRKMFHLPALPLVITCVRVPVLRAHSEAVVIETEKPLSPEEAREILSQAPGVTVVDDREANYFPMPLEASGKLDILVGRIREDQSNPGGHGLALFVSGDQLLKGAAWNAVQIAECLIG
ncbi:aspartate semialdehyde dehydrogenase [Verrucomicrobium sp. GAS474]|uniref:aspartate-semialdehyde dehydrogenase n=1 Tax=Verrucomicrobium sp. GAS474 TaxID=1882831 RepID=UPI000879AFA8|nr:aspartate-semialdehyde dehydrogenase [Verrucomicrobium sp. GAS474]SDU20318.1 aspartate semialdehyde dehydrogenase [Verrucomicrobium sp. GAS474]